MIARGLMLSPDQPVILHMLDIPPAAEALIVVKLGLVDAAFPLPLKTLMSVMQLENLLTPYNNMVLLLSKHASFQVPCDQVRDSVFGSSGVFFLEFVTNNFPMLPHVELNFFSCFLHLLIFITVNMGVCTLKSFYGVPAGLIYSFPVTCRNGEWNIVQGMLIVVSLRVFLV
ncbi:putative malate dehydrogenase [Dioscorea sansibarensis]